MTKAGRGGAAAGTDTVMGEGDGFGTEGFAGAVDGPWATAREGAIVLACGADVDGGLGGVATVSGSGRAPRARKDARRSANIFASAMLLNSMVAVCSLLRLDTVTALLEETVTFSISRNISCFATEVERPS